MRDDIDYLQDLKKYLVPEFVMSPAGLKSFITGTVESDRIFFNWLLGSNNPKIRNAYKLTKLNIQEIEIESLQSILDILLKEPEADKFWYKPTGELCYLLKNKGVFPGNSLKVNDRIYTFIRDIRIKKLLNE